MSPVSTPSKISIQNPTLMVELGNQRRSNPPETLALADLGDADNNHFLCLDTTTPATAVAFPAGHLVDPNGDLNADSKVMVRR